MTTTADIMSLANDYANADNVIDSAQKQQALRLAVERLVAERDGLRSALINRVSENYRATLAGKTVCDADEFLSELDAALRGQP